MSSIESSGFTGIAAGDLLNEAYQVTLTNTGSVTAEVNGLSVILYAGTNPVEIGSDSENVDQTFIAPGQSLTWTERPWNSYTSGEPAQGPFSAGQVGAVDPTGTCSLVQWTHP